MDPDAFRFDVRTALLTALAIPVVTYLAKLVVKYVREWLRYLIEGLLYEATSVIKHPVAARLSLTRYARLQLASTAKYLPVPSSQDFKLDVDTTFVPLTLEDSTGRTSQDYLHGDTPAARTRIVGDPGSGKSSLLKKMLREACQMALKNPRRSRLPILLELRHLRPPGDLAPNASEALGDWLYGVLRDAVARNEVYSAPTMFDLCTRSAGLLVLLDGLDEVSTADYPRIEAALNGLSTRLSEIGPTSAVVVTMRSQFHLQVKHAYDSSYPTVMRIQPFSPTDIYSFLTRWPFATHVRGRSISRIYEELTTRPTLRDMCRNPLVLSMYVAEHESTNVFIPPESRTDFYQRVTNELLIRRRLQQMGSTPGYSTLRDQRQRILGRIALDHLLDPTQPANSLGWAGAMLVVQEVTHCSAEDAPDIFRALSKETGLISEERTGETLRFIHLTFCEFFAAWEAVRGETDRWKELLGRHADHATAGERSRRPRLLEVIPFSAALRVPREAQMGAVVDVSHLGDPRLLARTFLETKSYDHPEWVPFIESQRVLLLKAPEANWDDEWLKDLHLFNVIVLDAAAAAAYVKQPVVIDLNGFFKTLLTSQLTSLERVLTTYATQDAAAAFYLCEVSGVDLAARFPHLVIRSCDQSPFFGLVLEKATQAPASRWLRLLAEAALASAVAARWLAQAPSPMGWSPALAKVNSRKRWYATGVAARSALTECLTIASLQPIEPTATPLLKAISGFPSPTRVRTLRAISVVLTVIPICLMVAGQSRFTLRTAADVTGNLSAALLLLLLTLLLAGWFCGRLVEGYRMLYAAVLHDPELTTGARGRRSQMLLTWILQPWSWMSRPSPAVAWRVSQFFVVRPRISFTGPLLPTRVWRLGHDFILRREKVALGR